MIEQTKALKRYQEEPSPKEVLEMIPMLSREDIKKTIQPLHNTMKELHGVQTLHHEIHTNNIVYLQMLFDADACKDYMPQMSFLSISFLVASHSFGYSLAALKINRSTNFSPTGNAIRSMDSGNTK